MFVLQQIVHWGILGLLLLSWPPLPRSLNGFSPWEPSNPGGGGAFNAIEAGPTGTILAASDLSGAYISYDHGTTWQVIGASRGLTVTHVSGLGFDPLDSDILYIGTEEGIFRSADGGRTFNPVLTHGYITDIAFAPSSPAIGYAAYHSQYDVADGTVYKTRDRGRTWFPLGRSTLPRLLHILELFVDPRTPEVVYLLAGEGRFACGPAVLYESLDGGNTWQRLASHLGQIAHAALAPHNPDTLYVTTYGDVWDPGYTCVHDDPSGGFLYRGTFDGTWHWTRLTNASDVAARNLLVWPDAEDAETLRVIDLDYAALWESIDGGNTWTFLGDKDGWDTGWTGPEHAYGTSFNGDAKTIGFDPSDPDALLWVDSQFIWATQDKGRTFGPLYTSRVGPGRWRSRGADNVVPLDIALAADGRHVYLALADMGCFRSEDAGESWQNCNDPAYVGSWEGYGGNSMTVIADPSRGNVVWMTQAEEVEDVHVLLRSEDYGAHWKRADRGLPAGIPSGLSVDPHSPTHRRTLFITVNGDVFRSQDDGRSGQRVLSCGGCRYTAVDLHDSRIVYAGGEAGFWRSTQGGDDGTWVRTEGNAMLGEGEEFWDRYWRGVAAITPDPHVPGRVYAAVYGPHRGLYRSEDYGRTWTQVLRDDFLLDVAVSPLDARVLVVASSSARYSGGYDPASNGVRYTSDGGVTWHSLNRGLPWPFASEVRFTPDGQTLWLASPGTGYYHRPADDLIPWHVAHFPWLFK